MDGGGFYVYLLSFGISEFRGIKMWYIGLCKQEVLQGNLNVGLRLKSESVDTDKVSFENFISVNFVIISLLTTKQINVNLSFLYSSTKFINYTL